MRPRYATTKDVPDVEDLLRTCQLPVEGVREHINRYLVSRDSSGIIGCAALEQYGKVGLLRCIAVARRARFAGLGNFILSLLVADARERGIESLIVHSTGAERYFEQIGFTAAETSELPDDLRRSLERTSPCDALDIMQVAL
ncbi:GNAT family N-acetyltransferase [Paraburkholderia sacchari]|uniref:GNAT family N-acetyltransferase n=1 Tax=Paraburkholderia sacchari TaxID=159450 RepID=UPI000541DE45|nr:GNAT family N-acetyltransferase [Paraburkholderia sacchari]NLP65054.1 GNAT family N-acetyltransferase [Paraburkholderia sacchari]